jgi:hypothetical protein
MYPLVIPHITDHIGRNRSALFPILVIIRGLKWSEDGKESQNLLYDKIYPILGDSDQLVGA